MSVTGNVYGANIVASFLYGDGSNISNLSISPSKIYNGNSYANIASSDGNLVIAVGASSNAVATFTEAGIYFDGNFNGGFGNGGITVNGNLAVQNGNIYMGKNGSVSPDPSRIQFGFGSSISEANVAFGFGQLAGLLIEANGANSGNVTIESADSAANIQFTNATFGNMWTISGYDGSLNSAQAGINISATGNVVANEVYGNHLYDSSLNNYQIVYAYGANIGQLQTSSSLAFTGGGAVLSVGVPMSVSGNVSATGNVTGGNVLTGGEVSATGNVYGANVVASFLYGDGSNISNLAAGSANKIFNGNSYANIASSDGNLVIAVGASSNVVATYYDTGVDFSGNVSAVGNIIGGNIVTAGSSGNISGADYVLANIFSATGNIYGGNIVASFLYGDGSNISNLAAGSANKIFNGNSYANIASSDGNLVIAVGASSNVVATYYDTGVDFSGNVSAVGNVYGGNIVTAGSNGNISGADYVLANVVNTNTVLTLAIYANATVRDTTITSPTAGMLIFNTSAANFQGYDGSNWGNITLT